ncbi:hypothetical protein XENOCAPTIV_024240 [Xenoophorus captivus]|uniref:Uncharacterized protein n=1 Tax=Xenoophorus captivus TaxID=1517983 RepID=A0ABV0QF20_9TELE
MVKRFNFHFIKPQDMSPLFKLTRHFWSDGFILAERPFRSCCFTVNNDPLLPASASNFIRSFAFILGLTKFDPKHVHFWDTEHACFLNGMMAGHFPGVCLSR